ncbi:MAG: hypothetical protein ACHQ2F_13760 [Desulfobaccales bacterium]
MAVLAVQVNGKGDRLLVAKYYLTQRRQKVLNKPAKKRIKKIIWRILQRTVSLDKLSFAASGRTGNAPFPLTNKGK